MEVAKVSNYSTDIVELSLCYYSIRKPIRDQVFSKVVVFPRYGMDGLDHGGTDYFFFTTCIF
jgi:hypothetical protein